MKIKSYYLIKWLRENAKSFVEHGDNQYTFSVKFGEDIILETLDNKQEE